MHVALASWNSSQFFLLLLFIDKKNHERKTYINSFSELIWIGDVFTIFEYEMIKKGGASIRRQAWQVVAEGVINSDYKKWRLEMK